MISQKELLDMIATEAFEPESAEPTGSEPVDQFVDGVTWLAAWLVDHAEGEEVTEENVLRWATDAMRGRHATTQVNFPIPST